MQHSDRLGNPEPLFLKVPEVAERLRIGRNRAYEMVAAGEIPSVRIGPKLIRIPREAFERYLAEQGVKA